MIPIKYFWSKVSTNEEMYGAISLVENETIKYFWNKVPTNEVIYEAMNFVKNEKCVVVINWTALGYSYSMTVRKGMSFEQCKSQIFKVYGL